MTIIVLISGILISSTSYNAFAMPNLSPQDLYKASEMVFYGQVISKQAGPGPDYYYYLVKVQTYFKNPQTSDSITVAGHKPSEGHVTYPQFEIGYKIIFYINKIDGINTISPYSQKAGDACDVHSFLGPEYFGPLGNYHGGPSHPRITDVNGNIPERILTNQEIVLSYDDVWNNYPESRTIPVSISIQNEDNGKQILNKTQNLEVQACSFAGTLKWNFVPTEIGNYYAIIDIDNKTKIPMGFSVIFDSTANSQIVLSPLKQLKSGIAFKDIVCRHNLQLIVKKDGLPVCLKPQTAQKLVERGWGTIVTSPRPTSCLTGQVMVNGQCVTSIPINPVSKCSTGYSVIQISAGSYLCQPTNPPPLSNATTYSAGQKVGVFTISTINPYNVTGYYNSPYPIGRPGLGDFTIMHVGDTLNPTCDGSAPLVITAINYPTSITVSIGKSMGKTYGCPICLSANSVIRTPNGDVSIKDIKEGTTVWSTNSNGIIIKSKVIKINNVLAGDTHKVIDLQLADGRELFASPNHPTYDGRIIANLKVGGTYDGSIVKSIELVPYKYQFTYDILPNSQTGNYWANEILVGSTLK